MFHFSSNNIELQIRDMTIISVRRWCGGGKTGDVFCDRSGQLSDYGQPLDLYNGHW